MRSFSFQNTIVTVNGVEITGWAEGDDVISIKRLTDAISHKVGASGAMMISISADRSGEFAFKLQQTSSSNKYLNDLCNQQQGVGGRVGAFIPAAVQFADVYRQDLASGTTGYIKKPTEIQRGDHAATQEWTIVVEDLEQVLGNVLT